MGNCTSGQQKKKKQKEDSATANDNKPNEEVMYASINLNTAKVTRPQDITDDCDYATIKIPETVQADSDSDASSKEECADDYVLME